MRRAVLFSAAILLLLGLQASAQEAVTLKLADARVSVLKADGSPVDTHTDAYPKTVLKGAALSDDLSLEVSVSVKDQNGAAFKPQQVMLLLVSEAGGAAAYILGKSRRDGSHTLTVTPSGLEKQLGKLGGSFEVLLLVGDPAAAKGLTWKLGTVRVAVDKEAPSVQAPTATQQRHVFSQPEIIHQHRPATQQPPAAISIAFAAAALGCLAILVLALLSVVGVNFQAFPSGAGGLYQLLFHGGIGAMLLLYLAFWTRLNLLQTLPIAAVIGSFVLGSGYKALSALADARIEEGRKKKE